VLLGGVVSSLQKKPQKYRQSPGRSQPGQQHRPAEDEDAAEANEPPEAEVPLAKLLRPPLPLMTLRHVISIGTTPSK